MMNSHRVTHRCVLGLNLGGENDPDEGKCRTTRRCTVVFLLVSRRSAWCATSSPCSRYL